MVPKKSTQPKDDDLSQAEQSMLNMDSKELNKRLEWLDTEIALLSTQVGLSERILALNFTRAKFVAIRTIQQAMETARRNPGLWTQHPQK